MPMSRYGMRGFMVNWVKKLNALLASLLTILNWEVLLTLRGQGALQRDLDIAQWALING